MRLRLLLLVPLLAVMPGCTVAWLRMSTNNQAKTLSDLQFRQVLDNLAMFSANPDGLPFHVNLREGTTQVTDGLNFGAVIDLGPPVLTQPEVLGNRTVVTQWGVSPVIDRAELSLMRVAYRRAHGSDEMPTPEFLDDLAHKLKDQQPSNVDLADESQLFYEYEGRAQRDFPQLESRIATTNDDSIPGRPDPKVIRSPLSRNVARQVDSVVRDLAEVRGGWFRTGRKRDVPRDACYVGHYEDCYVWVGPEGRGELTKFTLTMLELAALIKETQTLLSPGQVKFSPSDRG